MNDRELYFRCFNEFAVDLISTFYDIYSKVKKSREMDLPPRAGLESRVEFEELPEIRLVRLYIGRKKSIGLMG